MSAIQNSLFISQSELTLRAKHEVKIRTERLWRSVFRFVQTKVMTPWTFFSLQHGIIFINRVD